MQKIRRMFQLARFAFDCVVLFVIASIVSSAVHHELTPGVDAWYLFWFAISMYPFALYLRYRQVVDFENWDLLTILPMLGLFAVFFHIWGASVTTRIFWFLSFGIWLAIRSFFIPLKLFSFGIVDSNENGSLQQ